MLHLHLFKCLFYSPKPKTKQSAHSKLQMNTPDVEAFKNLKYPPLQEHSGCYCGPVWPNIGSWDAYLGLPSTTQPESARCNRKWLCSGLRDVRQVRYSRERKKTLWGTTGTIKNNIIRNSWTVLEHGCWGKRGDLSDVSMRGLDRGKWMKRWSWWWWWCLSNCLRVRDAQCTSLRICHLTYWTSDW